MAPKKRIIGYADEESFRRVRDATRRVRTTPRVGAQRRRQVPIVGGGTPATDDTPDTDPGGIGPLGFCPTCCMDPADACVEDCAECMTAPLQYSVQFGGLGCCDGEAGGHHILTHDEGCVWKGEVIEGEDEEHPCFEAQWTLTVGETETTLSLVTEDGTLTYRADGWCCLCNNELELDGCPPSWCTVRDDDGHFLSLCLPRRVCVTPREDDPCSPCFEFGGMSTCANCPGGAPDTYLFDIGFTGCCGSGTHALHHDADCAWKSEPVGEPSEPCDDSPWTLTIAGGCGPHTLTLATEHGTITYERSGPWRCLCGNTLTLESAPVECEGLPETVCVSPVLSLSPCTGSLGACPDGVPDHWAVPMSGIQSGGCDSGPCGQVNATHIVPFIPAQTPCTWIWVLDNPSGCPCSGGTVIGSHGVNVQYSAGSDHWTVSFAYRCSTDGFTTDWTRSYRAIYRLPGSEFNCYGSNTLPRIELEGTGCTGFPEQITISPAP